MIKTPLNFFIHDKALCESSDIGENTRIWAFVHILAGAKIGNNCNICDHVFVENDVSICNNVTIKCGVQLWDGIEVQDNVFIGPNVTFTNDKFPRSKVYPKEFLKTIIKRGASIGANATILPGISIGQHAMVGAGSVVTESIPDNAIVLGNPARIVDFNQCEKFYYHNLKPNLKYETFLKNVSLYSASTHKDNRGQLSYFEFDKLCGIQIKRTFTIFDIKDNKYRGNHAHKKCHQLISCLHGSVKVMTDDGKKRQIIELNAPNIILHIAPRTWNVLFDFKDNPVINVHTSDYYDRKDYFNEYSELLSIEGLYP